ncbi:Deoxyribose-phosphate aldolase [termite gut metagenome]|uniref:deoxyribose-phosphate aldolase n=1 Tax=termite gut metagenome TaxID=433724 RepID=A0A5J4PU75_9ZZZZ
METNNISHNKYETVLSKYNTNINNHEIEVAVNTLISKKIEENHTKEIKELIYSCIDLTTLNYTDNDESIIKFVKKINAFENECPNQKNVAAVCVYPNFVQTVKNTLETDNVNIACVSGNFPSSQTFIEVKVAETAMAIMEGADEIDTVISVGRFLNGDYDSMCEELQEIKEVCKDRLLEVIIETGALRSASNIKKATILAIYSGADFIKTSTGKIQPAATPEAAFVICETIKEYYKLTGIKIGFKAAGGIRNINDATVYYTIVKEILGKEWLNKGLFRIGTSETDLLSKQ